mmetsp:Transcript_67115/g.131623  ORF Transcript_67115/g.131623 Transcript_67115/m.131623 type:complete len:209 (-) Transcript_67115:696-1322(-)
MARFTDMHIPTRHLPVYQQPYETPTRRGATAASNSSPCNNPRQASPNHASPEPALLPRPPASSPTPSLPVLPATLWRPPLPPPSPRRASKLRWRGNSAAVCKAKALCTPAASDEKEANKRVVLNRSTTALQATKAPSSTAAAAVGENEGTPLLFSPRPAPPSLEAAPTSVVAVVAVVAVKLSSCLNGHSHHPFGSTLEKSYPFGSLAR